MAWLGLDRHETVLGLPARDSIRLKTTFCFCSRNPSDRWSRFSKVLDFGLDQCHIGLENRYFISLCQFVDCLWWWLWHDDNGENIDDDDENILSRGVISFAQSYDHTTLIWALCCPLPIVIIIIIIIIVIVIIIIVIIIITEKQNIVNRTVQDSDQGSWQAR